MRFPCVFMLLLSQHILQSIGVRGEPERHPWNILCFSRGEPRISRPLPATQSKTAQCAADKQRARIKPVVLFFAPNLHLKQVPVEKKHRQGHCRVQRLRHVGMNLLDSSAPSPDRAIGQTKSLSRLFSVCLRAGCCAQSAAHSFLRFL